MSQIKGPAQPGKKKKAAAAGPGAGENVTHRESGSCIQIPTLCLTHRDSVFPSVKSQVSPNVILPLSATPWVCACVQFFPSCLTLCNPMDRRPPGSSVRGVLSRQEYCSGLPRPPPGIFMTQGSNPHLIHALHWQAGSLPLVPPGKPLPGSDPTETGG